MRAEPIGRHSIPQPGNKPLKQQQIFRRPRERGDPSPPAGVMEMTIGDWHFLNSLRRGVWVPACVFGPG